MKKITLIFLLLATSLSFAQDPLITWDNYDENAILSPGQIIPVTLTWTSSDMNYICMWVREYDSGGNMVKDYAAFGFCPYGADDDVLDFNPDSGTETVQFPVPDDTPTTLAAGNYLNLVIYMTSDGAADANGDQRITVSATASDKEFSKLTSFYPNPASDVIYFGNDVVTETYKILGLTGALIKEVPALSNSLDISDLSAGLYFVVTDSGTARLLKQ